MRLMAPLKQLSDVSNYEIFEKKQLFCNWNKEDLRKFRLFYLKKPLKGDLNFSLCFVRVKN